MVDVTSGPLFGNSGFAGLHGRRTSKRRAGKLADLIAAASAPGLPGELVGEDRARSMFESASATWPKPGHLRRPVRAAVVAASVASLFATTTALAAASDLPAPAAACCRRRFPSGGDQRGATGPRSQPVSRGDSCTSSGRPLRQYGGGRAPGCGAPVGTRGSRLSFSARFGEQCRRPGQYQRLRFVRNHPGNEGAPQRSSGEHRAGEVPEAGPRGRGRRSPRRTQDDRLDDADRSARQPRRQPGHRVGQGREGDWEPRGQPGRRVREGDDREEG